MSGALATALRAEIARAREALATALGDPAPWTLRGPHERDPLAELSPPLSRLRAILHEVLGHLDPGAVSTNAPDELDALVEIRRAIEGAWVVWDYFRARLAARHVERANRYLTFVDDLALACLADLDGLDAYAVAPICFFHEQPGPEVWPRGRTVVPPALEPKLRAVFEAVIFELPVALIGLPWSYYGDASRLTTVCHEAGHLVYTGLKLAARVEDALGACGDEARWRAWAEELFADAWGVLFGAEAYVEALTRALIARPIELVGHAPPSDGEWGGYPSALSRLRIVGCLHTALGGGPTPLLESWTEALDGSEGGTAQWVSREQAGEVAAALLRVDVAGRSLGSRRPAVADAIEDVVERLRAQRTLAGGTSAVAVARALARVPSPPAGIDAVLRYWGSARTPRRISMLTPLGGAEAAGASAPVPEEGVRALGIARRLRRAVRENQGGQDDGG